MKKIVIAIFLFTIVIRIWNLNEAGRTADEFAYIDSGYKFIELIKKGDFKNPYWNYFPDHPPLAKYLYGLAAHFDTSKDHQGKTVYNFDWTTSRMISVIFSSLAVLLVVLFGWRYFSPSIGIIAGIILALLPVFVGLSQLVALESIRLFFYTATIYSFIRFLEKPTWKRVVLTGILLGLSVGVKESCILLIPTCLTICGWFFVKQRQSNKKALCFKIIVVLVVGFIIFIALWPALWFHPVETLQNMFLWRSGEKVPTELFLGVYDHVPKSYYIVYFLVTTPSIILALFIWGARKAVVVKEWVYIVLLIWFIIPFSLSFYSLRLNGIRYVIEMYAPLSLVTAIGFHALLSKVSITKSEIFRVLYFLPIALYLFIILVKTTPYYLDYYNIFVGGSLGVYENKSFPLSWWGEGQREAVIYFLENGITNVVVALDVEPGHVSPPVSGIIFPFYNSKYEYDYIIINYLRRIIDRFDERKIESKYNLVHSVMVDGAPIVDIYKHK